MSAPPTLRRRTYHATAPVLALVCLTLSWGRELPMWLLAILGLVLAAAVMSAVHHAEVVAVRVGEPYGSLVLAVAVTIIEVALIVTLMISDPLGTEGLARDTVFAALMITCNGIVGLSLLARTLRGGEATFNPAGAVAGLSAITIIATFSLVLPSFTTSSDGPTLTATQLAFAALASLTIYLLFVFVQAIRHHDYFLPDVDDPDGDGYLEDEHIARPSDRVALTAGVASKRVSTSRTGRPWQASA